MLKNYLAAALRNLRRNRLYAVINIAGLAIGFAAALFIALFIRDELSYDSFVPSHERIYRVHAIGKPPAAIQMSEDDGAQRSLEDWMTLEFPTIRSVAVLVPDRRSVRRGELEVEEDIAWTVPQFFEIFELPAIAGDLKTALSAPDGVVLTRSMARKYFGRADPLGQTLEIDRRHLVRVTAVLEDLPSNTQLKLTIIGSSKAAFSNQSWWSAPTYVRLAPGASVRAIERTLPAAIDRRMPMSVAISGNQTVRWKWTHSLHLLPLTDFHLHKRATNGSFDPQPDYGTLQALAAIGALILLVANINFVNLMTARAARRGVEVGIRKVCGAERADLVVQFSGEALIYVALSLVLAVSLVELLLPAFNAFLDRTVVLDYGLPFGVALPALGLGVGVLAGAYPAFVMSAFRPSAVFKGMPMGGGDASTVRQALVVLQFAVLISLMLGAAVIYKQTAFAMNEGLRLDKEQVAIIRTSCGAAFKNEVQALPGVRAVACSFSAPLRIMGNSGGGRRIGEIMPFEMSMVDFGLFELYGLHPLAGRFFDREHATDVIRANRENEGSSVIINDELRRRLGFKSPQAAIGVTIFHARPLPNAPPAVLPAEIIGIVPDFPIGSVSAPIPPALFYIDPSFFRLMSVKLEGAAIPETVEAIRRAWQRVGEPKPIDLVFFEQHTRELYAATLRTGVLLAAAASIAVFIACLGLFGLAAYTTERRTKEIGIRKANGAGRGDIVRMLLWEFTRPVLLANLGAWPVAYHFLSGWLHGFAYHVDLGIGVFLAVGAAATAIALLTVFVHALLVSRARPVTTLRYE